jgi:hypothetical protein
MSEKDENIKEENENNYADKSVKTERYEYCWQGCYDEETDWIVETTILEVEGYEKLVYCPKCHQTWDIDHVQIKKYPRNLRQRGISSQYEE